MWSEEITVNFKNPSFCMSSYIEWNGNFFSKQSGMGLICIPWLNFDLYQKASF